MTQYRSEYIILYCIYICENCNELNFLKFDDMTNNKDCPRFKRKELFKIENQATIHTKIVI